MIISVVFLSFSVPPPTVSLSLSLSLSYTVGREIIATTGVALFVFLYNMLTGGYDDFSQVHHDPLIGFLPKMTLPLAPFTLASSSLGLLLVFRTNTAYQRWDEARKNWGMNMYVDCVCVCTSTELWLITGFVWFHDFVGRKNQ